MAALVSGYFGLIEAAIFVLGKDTRSSRVLGVQMTECEFVNPVRPFRGSAPDSQSDFTFNHPSGLEEADPEVGAMLRILKWGFLLFAEFPATSYSWTLSASCFRQRDITY